MNDVISSAFEKFDFDSGAFIAEIVRGSLDSIDPGQKEAGLSLGLTPMQTMIHLIIPPAFRSMLPALFNQFIISVKDTALLSVIVVNEITKQIQNYAAISFKTIQAYTTGAIFYVVLINSLGVVLMLYSGSGISAIFSVPYAFLEVFNKISLGTWTYIFQGLLVLSLMVMRKKFVAPYLFSFVVGFAFSEMLDVHEMWINVLPTAIGYRVIYFIISYLLLCIGIALSNRCGLPIIPTDLFPRELADITKVKYSRIKIGMIGDKMDQHVRFESFMTKKTA